MANLLAKAVDANAFPDYATRLLSILSSEANKPIRVKVSIADSTKQTDTQVTISVRELEVLRLIAGGKSNKAIADELYLSVGTVKRHVNNIYSKLGIENRSQAVSRARELGLA
jgi:LuxR family maltose regulon positive regulatory protein